MASGEAMDRLDNPERAMVAGKAVLAGVGLVFTPSPSCRPSIKSL